KELEAELGEYPRSLEIDADELRGRFAARIIEKKRPSLLTVHLVSLDHVQHERGPGSPESFATLERLDTVIGMLRAAAERPAPGRASVAIVSDHGFARTETQLNLVTVFREARLITVDGGKVTDWKAMPWTSGGAAAIVLKDAQDDATRVAVKELL